MTFAIIPVWLPLIPSSAGHFREKSVHLNVPDSTVNMVHRIHAETARVV